MFGYLIYNDADGSEMDRKTYQDCYCGLCNRLYFNYGNLGRNTLSYDLTFVNILLNALYSPSYTRGEERCLIHPVKKHTYCYSDITDYCCDMNILLSYYHFLDDWNDDHNRKARSLADKLQPAYTKIKDKYPEKVETVERCLSAITDMEKHNVLNPDGPCNLFGELMARILDYKDSDISEKVKAMGYHLGRFIYLMDAYMDFKDDIRKERYNPLIKMDLNDVPDILENIMAQCCLVYEELPVSEFKSILDNVLYCGVWTRYSNGKDKK